MPCQDILLENLYRGHYMQNKLKDSDYYIKDINLHKQGELLCGEALNEMTGLKELEKMYKGKKPLQGIRIVGTVLVSLETANFVILLKKLGADVRWCSDSYYYSDDRACAYLAHNGIPIFAKNGLTEEEYYSNFNRAVNYSENDSKFIGPEYLIGDGAELIEYMLTTCPHKLASAKGACEQTTSGVTLLRSRFLNKNKLPFPVISVNDSVTKSRFDNIYGSRESLVDGLKRSVNMQIAGKRAVVFGFGEVGKGCAQVMRGLGAHVSIVEIDPIMAMQAMMEGYEILSKQEACSTSDILITATGCIKTIDTQEILNLKSGSVIMNMSEHDMEINATFFRTNTDLKKVVINDMCEKFIFPDGKTVYFLCNGFIVNLYAGNGHPPSVMGMTFTNHVLALIDFVHNPSKYTENKIYRLSRELDEQAALLSFPQLAGKLNVLSDEQCNYLGVAKEGPFKTEDYRY